MSLSGFAALRLGQRGAGATDTVSLRRQRGPSTVAAGLAAHERHVGLST